MTTSFSSLPILDLSPLCRTSTPQDLASLLTLSTHLYTVFSTTGFAYLTNVPLTFTHDNIFTLTKSFFAISDEAKLKLAKKTFVTTNPNTYRGYFPPQPGQQDNLKEGFEFGAEMQQYPSSSTSAAEAPPQRHQRFNLSEPNVWPSSSDFPSTQTQSLQALHTELQTLSTTLLSLLAIGLGERADFFDSYVHDSLSTLRLLHYPPAPPALPSSDDDDDKDHEVTLCCTPHTDSGILTLLHQDKTGGLEVRNADGKWVGAPYLPGSIVVNIGDLLAQFSGGRLVATMHRVRRSRRDGVGRLSVPFFFEPGETCVLRGVDGGGDDDAVITYGEYVRRKMGTWVEYRDVADKREEGEKMLGVGGTDAMVMPGMAVEAC